MTVPTFFNLDNGLGSADKPVMPYIVIQTRLGPLYIWEDAPPSGGGGGDTRPPYGQALPRWNKGGRQP